MAPSNIKALYIFRDETRLAVALSINATIVDRMKIILK